MSVQIDAVFENGVFRPTGPVALNDQQQVRLTIDPEGTDPSAFLLNDEAWTAFCDALEAPSRMIPRLQHLLAEPGVFDARRTAAR